MFASACMIGSSVVPGLPNRCVTPSSLSSARNAERPVMWFLGVLASGELVVANEGARQSHLVHQVTASTMSSTIGVGPAMKVTVPS